MNILYIHQYFTTPTMPGGTRSFEFGRRLVAMGHEVTVVTTFRGETECRGWHVTEEAGMQVHWLPVRYSNHMGFAQRLRAFIDFAARGSLRAASLRSDVIFATSTPLTVAIPGVAASRWQRRAMVFEVRDLWPELPIAVGALQNPILIAAARHLERFAYRNSKHVIALSPGMKAGVAKTGVPDSAITVIPNASDISFFQGHEEGALAFRRSHAWLQERPLAVYIGTLGRINGVGYLARLAAALRPRAPHVRFLVVGDGAEAMAVEREATELGVLNENFYMLPKVPKEAVPAILAAADVALSLFIDLPEMWSNSANKFFDALAAGKPVAINYQGWQADAIEDAGAGIVLDANDVERAAITLHERLDQPGWLVSASRSALRLAETSFDRDKLAAELERVLVSAAAASP
jgi:glycosyltransferase involved in cell wall biosynthesis